MYIIKNSLSSIKKYKIFKINLFCNGTEVKKKKLIKLYLLCIYVYIFYEFNFCRIGCGEKRGLNTSRITALMETEISIFTGAKKE